MKLFDIFEDLRRVPQRESNPDWTAEEVVRKILSDYNVSGEVDLDTTGGHSSFGDLIGKASVEKSWARMKNTGEPSGIYDPFGSMPGEGGVIGLPNPKGKRPSDIASAAHEAFHALLQLKYKNYQNEHVVNRLAARWLQDNYSGRFLHLAINDIRNSRVSYKGKKYDTSKKHLEKEREAMPKSKKPWW